MNKLNRIVLIGIIAGTMFSCFEKFDPESYRPAFEIGGFSAADEIEPSSLVGYWSFDGTLNEAKSGNSSENAGATFVNGFKGQAINFNVANKSYLTFSPSSSLTGVGSFTISFWVNPTFIDANGDNGIDGILGLVNLSNPTGFWGNIDWFVENGSNPSAAKIVAHITNSTGETWMDVSNFVGLFGNWTNHTLTYEAASSTFTYYINGSIAKTATAGWEGPITFANSGKFVFGTVHFQTTPTLASHGAEPWASYLTGSMDEIRIYNKALSGDDVNALVVLQGKGK
jgi:hypothetical protein